MQGSSGDDSPPLPRWSWGIALLLVVWSLIPFRAVLSQFPWKIDAIKWVTRASTESDWVEWVFFKTHFVGYRPVTALSFTVDHALGGWTPEIYRLTDFGLHVAVLALVLVLFSRLSDCRNLLALVPVLLLAGHPAVEETLPYLPRRSYTLACMFSLGALVLWLDATKHAWSNWRTWVATLLLMLGLLSNETSYVMLPMLPLLAWHRGEALWRALKRGLVPLFAAIPCIIVRFAVLGWAGGYEKHYFAFTRNGRKTLRQVESFNLPEIVGASFDYAFFPVSFGGADTITRRFTLFTFVIASFYCWAMVIEPLLNWRIRSRRLPLLLTVWMFGYAVLYGISRTWFWRQGYPMAVVLGLIAGVIAAHTWSTYRGRNRLLRMVPQVLLGFSVLWTSPMFNGMTHANLWHRFAGNAAIHQLDDLLGDRSAPLRAYLVLPFNKNSNRNVITWMNKVRPEQEFLMLGTSTRKKAAGELTSTELVLGPGAKFTKSFAKEFDNGRAPLRELMDPDVETGIFYLSEPGVWTWAELK